tara:strand:+ start:825 stop:1520 length:696 start_codon:yes stop_codon:yes gene_type:complete
MIVYVLSLGIFCISLFYVGCGNKFSDNDLVKRCESGDLASCVDYLKLYEKSDNQSQDPLFVKVLTQAAKLGNSAAMFELAVRATDPSSSPADIKSAIYWFKKASMHGDSVASLNLGLIYDHGIGTPSDLIQARYWYKKAADSGNAEALFNLGVCLDEGLGGAVDKPAAIRAYRLGFERGHARSAYNLALMMGRGEGIVQNWESALNMLKNSKRLGYQPAEKLLKKWSQLER